MSEHESGTSVRLPPPVEVDQRMSRAAWREEQQQRLEHSRQPIGPATFQSWSFRSHPAMVAVAVDALKASEPGWVPTWVTAPVEGDAPDQTRRMHVADADASPVDAGRDGQIAWLDWLGTEIEDRQRATWRRAWTSGPEDLEAAAIWTGLLHGNPWSVRERCESAWLPLVDRVFAGVIHSRDLPPQVARRVRQDLRDAFFLRLLGPAYPGWRELAVRVLETRAPIDGPARELGSAVEAAGGCITSRRGWASTVASVLPTLPDREGRATRAATWVQQPGRLEALLDLHVLLRLIDRAPSDLGSAWRIVTQNRGKARGRLRALAVERSDLGGLLELDALGERTRVALARWAWAWAWQELAHDFSFDGDRPLSPPCDATFEILEPLDDDGSDALAVWVLLVALKGRSPHLRRWVHEGGTGDRDSTWARLQADLPQALRDPDGGYRRVRIHLHDTLDPIEASWRPLMRELASLKPGRTLKRTFLQTIEPVWHAQVPLPRSGFPTFQEHLRQELGDGS